MTDPSQLSLDEFLLVGGLILLIGWQVQRALGSADWIEIYSPTIILAMVLSYYCLLGPLLALAKGEWFDRGINIRDAMIWGWGGAVVFYASVLVGFNQLDTPRFQKHFLLDPEPEGLHRLGTRLCVLGLVMFTCVVGWRIFSLISPVPDGAVQQETGLDLGAIANYFAYAVNLLIPGIILIWASWVRTRRHTPALIGWLLIAVGIYTSLGFRWRLAILVGPMVLLWFLVRRQRPGIAVVAAAVVVLILVSGLIGLSRDYGQGLNTSSLEGRTAQDYFDSGLVESGVFFTTGGVMQTTPKGYPFVGVDPLVATLLFPIPREFYPDKQSAEYVTNATAAFYGSANRASGSAILNYAEYYLMAGWPSLIGLSVLLGWLMRCLWNWFLLRRHELFAQCIYILSACFLYVVVSRGYLPLVVMLFGFTVWPLFWLYGRGSGPPTSGSSP
ncbi:hypothetical protein KBY66_15140 [Synechococcus sp. Tobar12-5m-g]|uniref:hypothetical protein n=1 Tax=unclassified Synechococcus TaxID=2626047 RepID=UPI0020CCD078|nr:MULTISPECIES: hypothetical protein [unclassified Synechococcus]MCP9773925.1 hypothetical protein [Synechococcus sp. Tobar12-5m-g]MCP9874939.1 hypothetical protein [Synechococcus sp. Cruz CV-v-12]